MCIKKHMNLYKQGSAADLQAGLQSQDSCSIYTKRWLVAKLNHNLRLLESGAPRETASKDPLLSHVT